MMYHVKCASAVETTTVTQLPDLFPLYCFEQQFGFIIDLYHNRQSGLKKCPFINLPFLSCNL